LRDADHDLTAQQWAMARTLETGESVLNEVVDIETFDGSRKTILNSTVMLKDELDRSIGAIFVNQDITSEMDRIREKDALNRSLEEAMADIKVLKGLLPICPDSAAGLYPEYDPAAIVVPHPQAGTPAPPAIPPG
jgi:hypothetical protein